MRILRIIIFFFSVPILAQPYSQADSLRGTLNGYRSWWDVLHYDLQITPELTSRSIQGSNKITFKTVKPGSKLQIDLQKPLKIDSILHHNIRCNWIENGNTYLVDLLKVLAPSVKDSLIIYYSGIPREAKFAPWDGGISWTKDEKGRPWVAVSCQGLGASVWWPNKDHLSDEPDKGVAISITIPDSLTNISNGRFQYSALEKNGKRTWKYKVTEPINNYDVTMNIGNYVTLLDTFSGKNGKLNIEYSVLDYNREKILSHLAPEAKRMLRCFEHWFGPYPFYADGYRIVETPYLGMEHQSAVAYGNKFKNGYLGRDRSSTGVGLLWDFIIVHESGHEWFGNNISSADIADNWIHEGFTTYSEVLFTEYYFNKDSAEKYLKGLRSHITNLRPVIGNYGVNKEGMDNYEKGANLVHMLRQVIANDSLFREILIGMNKTFAKKTVSTKEIENYISTKSNINFKPVFDQYLRSTKVPEFTYHLEGEKLSYKWTNCNSAFNMPLRVFINDKAVLLKVTTNVQELKLNEMNPKFRIDDNFYIQTSTY